MTGYERARAHLSLHRRVLFLGYSSGFQMWDCTNLASISEVLNLSGPSWGQATFAGVLPPPLADDGQLMNLRPLIGVMCVALIIRVPSFTWITL